MGLYERWTASGEDATDKIAVHTFASALREVARGSATKAQLASAFNLDATDQNELDHIASAYAVLPDAAKPSALVKLHDVMILAEAGFYNKAKCKTELGF